MRLAVRREHPAVRKLRLEVARLEQGDADSEGLHLHAQRVGQRLDRELGGRVEARERNRNQASDRADVHDEPAALLAKDRQHGAADSQHAEEVRLEQLARLGRRRVLDGPGQADARVVDHDVEPALPLPDEVDGSADGDVVAHVHRDHRRRRLGRRRRERGATACAVDAVAEAAEVLGAGLAEAGRSPGDEDDLGSHACTSCGGRIQAAA